MRKRLFYDLETSFCQGHFWRPGYNQTIHPHQITEYAKIISIHYKWEQEDKVHNLDWGLTKQCEKKMIEKFMKIREKTKEIINLKDTMFKCAIEIMKLCDPLFKPLSNDPARQDDNPFRNIHSLADDIKKIIKNLSDVIEAEIREIKAILGEPEEKLRPVDIHPALWNPILAHKAMIGMDND